MPERGTGWKGWFDRILRLEGAISFVQQISTAVALGGGAMTAAWTWAQGALSQFGFAGYVIIGLVVAILILHLLRLARSAQIQETEKDLAQPIRLEDHTVNLDAAAAVYQSVFYARDIKAAAQNILQRAADGQINIHGSMLLSNKVESGRADYSPSHELEPGIIKTLRVSSLDENTAEAELYGRFILIDDAGRTYGRLKLSLTKLLYPQAETR